MTFVQLTPLLLSLYLFVISETATIKQSFNDSAVVSTRIGRSSKFQKDNRYGAYGNDNENLRPESAGQAESSVSRSGVGKRCVKCVYYNPPPSRDGRGRYGDSYEYYERGYGRDGLGVDRKYDRDYYDKGADYNSRSDFYDRFDSGYDRDDPLTNSRAYDRGGYRGGYEDPGYPYNPRGTYDRDDYYRDNYDDNFGSPLPQRGGYYDRERDRGYLNRDGDQGRDGFYSDGYDRGRFGSEDYDYGALDSRGPASDRRGHRKDESDGSRRYGAGIGERDDYGGGRNYGGRDYDRGGYRPWDETTRGSSGWDSRGRGYYFATRKPEYDGRYAGGWPYGGGGGGGRRKWPEDDDFNRRKTSYLHDRDESSTSLVSSNSTTTSNNKGDSMDKKNISNNS